ncbi:PAS domain-containing protein [Curvivirga sp.]|uniref:PAS domain-containing protein n=1 Tax=Curvivirga sp. TaxID=2856848 RepID=UPI003B5A78F7
MTTISSHKITDKSFLSHCDAQLTAVFHWWEELPRNSSIPHKNQISPFDLKPFLPLITMVDVSGSSKEWFYRLVGTGEVEHRGRDVTKLTVHDNFHGDEWHDVLETYQYIIDNMCHIYDPSNVPNNWGGRTEDETLFLPFVDNQNNVSTILLISVN